MAHLFGKLRRFRFNLPQRIAAVLLAIFLLQGFWLTSRQTLTDRDYQYARCGRETWEKPSEWRGMAAKCRGGWSGRHGVAMRSAAKTARLAPRMDFPPCFLSPRKGAKMAFCNQLSPSPGLQRAAIRRMRKCLRARLPPLQSNKR